MPLEERSINTLVVQPAVEGGKVSTRKKGCVDDDRLPRDSDKSTPLVLGGAKLIVEVEEEEEEELLETAAQCEETACLQVYQPFLERSTVKDEGGSTLWSCHLCNVHQIAEIERHCHQHCSLHKYRASAILQTATLQTATFLNSCAFPSLQHSNEWGFKIVPYLWTCRAVPTIAYPQIIVKETNDLFLPRKKEDWHATADDDHSVSIKTVVQEKQNRADAPQEKICANDAMSPPPPVRVIRRESADFIQKIIHQVESNSTLETDHSDFSSDEETEESPCSASRKIREISYYDELFTSPAIHHNRIPDLDNDDDEELLGEQLVDLIDVSTNGEEHVIDFSDKLGREFDELCNAYFTTTTNVVAWMTGDGVAKEADCEELDTPTKALHCIADLAFLGPHSAM